MSIDLHTQLKNLRLYGMSDAWAEIKAEAPQRKQDISPEYLLSQLVHAEITDRNNHKTFVVLAYLKRTLEYRCYILVTRQAPKKQ